MIRIESGISWCLFLAIIVLGGMAVVEADVTRSSNSQCQAGSIWVEDSDLRWCSTNMEYAASSSSCGTSTTTYDFEDGTEQGWQAGNMGISAYGSYPSRGSYSLGAELNSGDGNPDMGRSIIPSSLQGGGQPDTITYYWRESSNSFGGAMQFLDSSGSETLVLATDNPNWDIRSASGTTSFYSGDGYDRWIKFTADFDWSADSVTVTGEDLVSGSTQTTTVNLMQSNSDIETLQIRNWMTDQYVNSNTDGDNFFTMYFDDISIVTGGSCPSPSGADPGDTWIEGENLHWVDQSSTERSMSGCGFGNPSGGNSEDTWVEDGALNYLDASQNQRVLGNTITCYEDQDGDGYGGDPVQVISCGGCPDPFVSNNNDCYDQNALANPDQTSYFQSDRGDGSYDYDCDTNEEQRYTATASDTCDGTPGVGTCGYTQSGWQNSVPGCGGSGTWESRSSCSCTCSDGSRCTTFTSDPCGNRASAMCQAGSPTTDGRKQECR